ncbi:MAG: anti-sigma factor antagonist [Verrucomicrobiaceae bacterium]|nr:MAG: anti-sigma factor antagonist [Verrucomicrobiaceae bacterium]
MNSPAVKAFGEERIAAGEKCLVVDLADCTGMDSTFMGTLAGMAARLSAADGGALQIAEPGERNRRSLEDLGLDFLMQIDPPDAMWRGKVSEIRATLQPPRLPGSPSRLQRTRHVLEAHQTLAGLNEKNARGFSGVVNLMEQELAEKSAKEKLAESGGNG